MYIIQSLTDQLPSINPIFARSECLSTSVTRQSHLPFCLFIVRLIISVRQTLKSQIRLIRLEVGRLLKPLWLLHCCRVGAIIYDWIDIPWIKEYYNFGFDQYNILWEKIGIRDHFDRLLENSAPFPSGDWIQPDLTLQESFRTAIYLHPDTYYCSFAPKILQTSQWRHTPDVPQPLKGYRDEDWLKIYGAPKTISLFALRKTMQGERLTSFICTLVVLGVGEAFDIGSKNCTSSI